MAKRAPSKHSRAARRETSPSINTDKSLKAVKPPQESLNHRPAILGLHHAAGVQKKRQSTRKTVLSAKARRRQEKGLDRAEAVMDRRMTKVEKSKGSSRTVHARKKTWDEINGALLAQGSLDMGDGLTPGKKNGVKDIGQAEVDALYEDTDEEMDAEEGGKEPDGEVVMDSTEVGAQSVNATAIPLPDEDEDEIL